MKKKSFVYTYAFLREVLKARQGLGDLNEHAFNNVLDHLDEAEKCEIPASEVAKILKKHGWVHLAVDERGKVIEVNENS